MTKTIIRIVLMLLLAVALGSSSCATSYKGRKYARKCRPCPSFNQVPQTSPGQLENLAQVW